MKTHSADEIVEMNPCYTPNAPEFVGRIGTIIDLLEQKGYPAIEKMWVAIHPGWISDNNRIRFLGWCISQAKTKLGKKLKKSKRAKGFIFATKDPISGRLTMKKGVKQEDVWNKFIAESYADYSGNRLEKEAIFEALYHVDWDNALDYMIGIIKEEEENNADSN